VIVQCDSCQTRFRVADDRVTPRGIKVRCSRCGNGFVVRREGEPAGADGPPRDLGFATPPAPPGPPPTTRVADPREDPALHSHLHGPPADPATPPPTVTATTPPPEADPVPVAGWGADATRRNDLPAGRLDPAPGPGPAPAAAATPPRRTGPLPVADPGARGHRRRDRAPAGGVAAVVHVILGLALLLALGFFLFPAAPGEDPGAGLLRLVAGPQEDPDLVPVDLRSALREIGPGRIVLVVGGAIERRRGPEGPAVVTAELVTPDGGVLARAQGPAGPGSGHRLPFRLVIADLPAELDRAGLRIAARRDRPPPVPPALPGDGISEASSP
jgi:predicted Zn finger-like uncharacterized protein